VFHWNQIPEIGFGREKGCSGEREERCQNGGLGSCKHGEDLVADERDHMQLQSYEGPFTAGEKYLHMMQTLTHFIGLFCL